MRKLWWCLLAILVWPRPMLSQLPGNATLVLFPGAPTGNCNSRQLALDQSNGSLYTCINAAATNQGTWQIVAGGGPGGGGWNPPNAPGDTIFGNNTVATSVPSFFTPGGDVSFSAGSFSVNRLHFGPNALSLTNTGIATGNCLQVSGSTLIGGACGTGPGGGLSGSGTVNLIPKFTAATALGNSLLTDNGTTLTYTGTGGIVAPKVSITQGPLQFTSVEGALPALPGANNNSLVSGPDGWYVSNANSAFFKIEPPGAGPGGTGVASFNGRQGAVLAQNNDYSYSQVTGAAPLASPAFTGTPTAPAPSGAAATSPGNNQIATTAFVFANAGTGGLTGTGVNTTFAKWTGASSLSSSLLTETGTTSPVLSYTGTGGIVALSPPANDNSTRVATTEWVQANYGPSSGGGGSVPIGRSAMTPTCVANDTATNPVLSNISVNIQTGDTVLVSVNTPNALSAQATTTIIDNASPSSNTYNVVTSRNQGSGSTQMTMNLLGTTPGTAKAATSMTVTQSAASKFVVCIATYVGVNQFGLTYYNSAANLTNPLSASLAVQDGGYVFAASGVAAGATFPPTWNPGQLLITGSSTTPGATSGSLCEHGSATAATVACTVTWGTGSYAQIIVAVELQPGVAAPAPTNWPKVVAFHRANINVTSAVNDTAFMACSITDCPAGGFYRVAWDFLGITGCTAGVFQVNVDYVDEADPQDIHHTGMMSSPGANVSGKNHVYGYRHMTVASALPTGPTTLFPSWSSPPNVGINVTTSVPTACSGGTGKVQMLVSIERMQ